LPRGKYFYQVLSPAIKFHFFLTMFGSKISHQASKASESDAGMFSRPHEQSKGSFHSLSFVQHELPEFVLLNGGESFVNNSEQLEIDHMSASNWHKWQFTYQVHK